MLLARGIVRISLLYTYVLTEAAERGRSWRSSAGTTVVERIEHATEVVAKISGREV